MKAKVYIFDMDGVITASSREHFLAWGELAKSLGKTLSPEVEDLVRGISRMDSLKIVLNDIGLLDAFTLEERRVMAHIKNDIYVDLISHFNKKNLFEGTTELFEKLKSNGIKIALGSASRNGSLLLNSMDIAKYFDYVVKPVNIKKGKPDPEIFLNVSDYFSFDTKLCVGIEDAVAGISAIKSANMFAIGIGDNKMLNQADVVYDGLHQIDIEVIDELLVI